jgi:VanZ family protein
LEDQRVSEPWRNPRPAPQLPELQARLRQTKPYGWLHAWWPAVVWACVIFVMSTDTFSWEHTAYFFEPILRWLIPSLTAHQFLVIHYCIRKSAHFTEYFLFCTLIYRGARGGRAGWRWTWGLEAFSVAAGYSALDEIHQAFVASRHASPYDSMIDSTGALFAITVLWLWFRFRRSAGSAPSLT